MKTCSRNAPPRRRRTSGYHEAYTAQYRETTEIVVDGDSADYDGEAVELDVRLMGIPGEHDPGAGPVQ